MTLTLLATFQSFAHAEAICIAAAEMEAGWKAWYGEVSITETQTGRTQMWAPELAGIWTLVNGNPCAAPQGGNWSEARNGELPLATLSE